MRKPALSDETLNVIVEACLSQAEKLSKRATKAMEKDMKAIIHAQLEKIDLKFEYLKKFWALYDMENSDLKMSREECLGERVALSALKSSGKVSG